jgi:hypothetical protein
VAAAREDDHPPHENDLRQTDLGHYQDGPGT